MYYIENDDYLAHHGVKGMKWGVRKDRGSSGGSKKKTKTSKVTKAGVGLLAAGAGAQAAGAAIKAGAKAKGYDFTPNTAGKVATIGAKTATKAGVGILSDQAGKKIGDAIGKKAGNAVAKGLDNRAKKKEEKLRKKAEKIKLKDKEKAAALEMKAKAKQLKKEDRAWANESNIDKLVTDAFSKASSENRKALQELRDSGLKGDALLKAYTEASVMNINKQLMANSKATNPSGSMSLVMAADNGSMIPVFINNKKK